MKISKEQLAHHSHKLLPCYLITGDEPLFVDECLHRVRECAKQQGFIERQVFFVENNFDWQVLRQETFNLSLFSDKKILELRLLPNKLLEASAKILVSLLERQPADKIIIFACGKLEKNALNTKWAKKFDEKGAIITLWPLPAAQLPRWIQQRLTQYEMSMDADALKLLAERVSGNLYAAQQEIEKLYLIYGTQPITSTMVLTSVADSSRFNLFQIMDLALNQELKLLLRTITGLKEEGVEPLLVLWGVARELRTLSQMADELAQGGKSAATLVEQYHIWSNRKPIFLKALIRCQPNLLYESLQDAATIDLIIKGHLPGDPWLALMDLVLKIAGAKHQCPQPKPSPTGMAQEVE